VCRNTHAREPLSTEQAQVGTARLQLILLTRSYRNQSTSLKNPLTVCRDPLLRVLKFYLLLCNLTIFKTPHLTCVLMNSTDGSKSPQGLQRNIHDTHRRPLNTGHTASSCRTRVDGTHSPCGTLDIHVPRSPTALTEDEASPGCCVRSLPQLPAFVLVLFSHA